MRHASLWDRLCSHIRIEGDCWTWTGPTRRHGGGDRPTVSMRPIGEKHPVTGGRMHPRQHNAARLMCEIIQGPPPDDGLRYEAGHQCGGDNWLCICPDHLMWETRSENMLRMHADRRAAMLEPDVYAAGVPATNFEDAPF